MSVSFMERYNGNVGVVKGCTAVSTMRDDLTFKHAYMSNTILSGFVARILLPSNPYR